MCQCWWSSSLNNTVKRCMLNCCRNLWASICNTQHINQWGLLQTVLALAQQTTFENCTKALNKSCSSQNQTISLSIASSYCWVCPSPLSVASYPGSFPKSLGTRLPWVHLALSITHVQYHPPSLFHTHTLSKPQIVSCGHSRPPLIWQATTMFTHAFHQLHTVKRCIFDCCRHLEANIFGTQTYQPMRSSSSIETDICGSSDYNYHRWGNFPQCTGATKIKHTHNTYTHYTVEWQNCLTQTCKTRIISTVKISQLSTIFHCI